MRTRPGGETAFLPPDLSLRRRGSWRGLAFCRPEHQIFSRSRQKPGEQSRNSLEQNTLSRAESVLAIAFDIQLPDLAPGHFHRDQNLLARTRKGELAGVSRGRILPQWRRVAAIHSEIDSNPAVMAALYQQFCDIFERRTMECWLVVGKGALNFRN